MLNTDFVITVRVCTGTNRFLISLWEYYQYRVPIGRLDLAGDRIKIYGNSNGLKLPYQYTVMSENEIEYDARFFWIVPCAITSIVCNVISLGVTTASLVGYKNDTLTPCAHTATVIGTATGVASDIGTLWTATSATSTASLAMAIADLSINPGVGIST